MTLVNYRVTCPQGHTPTKAKLRAHEATYPKAMCIYGYNAVIKPRVPLDPLVIYAPLEMVIMDLDRRPAP